MVSMLDCIRRVPERLKWILDHREKTFQPLDDRFGGLMEAADELVLIGCGTSNTSAVTARYPAQRVAGVRVTPVLPGEFLNEKAVRNPNALYAFVSQTGTSTLTRDALKEARHLGYRTVAVSESPDTPLAREADVFLDMGCGHEEYPMRTIGYSASVLTLVLLGLWMGERKGTVSPQARDACLADAARAARQIPAVINQTLAWLNRERRQMLRSDCLVFTGVGALYGVALEASVKVWETPQIISLAYELEEGLHAPNYGYTERHCVIVLNDGGADSQKARSLCAYMKNEKHNGFLIGADVLDEHDLPFECTGSLDCLVFAAATQTMAYQLAVSQGRDLFAPHDNRVMYSYFDTHNETGRAAKQGPAVQEKGERK